MKVPVILALSLSAGIAILPASSVEKKESATIAAQQNGFDMIRGHRQGKGVMIMWSMTSHLGIADYRVEATYEDPTDPYSVWSNRGTVPNSKQKMKQFRDTNVLPGVMYYRITARMTNGNTICSDICSIRIVSQ